MNAKKYLSIMKDSTISLIEKEKKLESLFEEDKIKSHERALKSVSNKSSIIDTVALYNTIYQLENPSQLSENKKEVNIILHNFPKFNVYFEEEVISNNDYRISSQRMIYKMLKIFFVLDESELTKTDLTWRDNFKIKKFDLSCQKT